MSDVQHLGELLSAHLDGELSPEEQARVAAHLAGCADCTAELEATSAVRARLRGAPAVDPPFGFLERLTLPTARRHGARSRWIAAASVVAVAAVWIVVLGVLISPERSTVVPPVDTTRAALADTQLVASLHRPEAATTRFPKVVLDRPLTHIFSISQGSVKGDAAIYGEDDHPDQWIQVSVLPATPEWSQLKGGLRSPVEGLPGNPWQSTDGNAMHALVFSIDGSTVMIVGQASDGDLQQAARELGNPSEESSVGDRLRSGAWSVVEAFG